MASLTTLSLGIAVVVLAIAGCESTPELKLLSSQYRAGSDTAHEAVFATDHTNHALHTLHGRQCLPGDFDWNNENHAAFAAILSNCEDKVTEGGLGDACDGVSAFSLYNICVANSLKSIDADGTFFDVDVVENKSTGYTQDADYTQAEETCLNSCKRYSDADLTPRQQAVYTSACFTWSLYSVCDQTQNMEQRLDAEGKLRHALFLSGDCPMSPSQLLDSFGLVTGRTWAECSQGLNTGEDSSQRYDAEVSRVTCLLQDFKTDAGNVDFPRLENAITTAEGGDQSSTTDILTSLVHVCGRGDSGVVTKGAMGTYKEISTEEFVKCWAGWGLFSCSYKEANQLAHQFPQTCTVSI